MSFGIRVDTTGPIADGSAVMIVDRMADDITEDVGQAVFNAVKSRLRQVLKNPTGYYESRVVTNTQSDSVEISDGGVIYGPWLEGESSRNSQTRFKGYHTFREVSQKMESEAVHMADDIVSRDLGKLS